MAQTAALRIGTRGSKLALWQAEAVGAALIEAHGLPPEAVEIAPIRTSGDRIQDRALAEAGGKGLFTKEIEAALLSGAIDIGVHSAKDMETHLPEGLMIVACLEREDPREALVSRHSGGLAGLPPGAVLGTASIRREALARRARPDLAAALLRGNVPTRLTKVEAGAFDATLLAAAGLKRLGLEAHISEWLPLDAFPPACGQGVVAVECRADDLRVRQLIEPIDHPATATALDCERAFLAALDGSCRTPIAGLAEVSGGRLRFRGMVIAHDGREAYEAALVGDPADAAALGRAAGADILARAPRAFLTGLGIG